MLCLYAGDRRVTGLDVVDELVGELDGRRQAGCRVFELAEETSLRRGEHPGGAGAVAEPEEHKEDCADCPCPPCS